MNDRGLEEARHVFLRGCGLPGAWSGEPQWRILDTGFGLGLNFLAAWQAWKQDPQRPRLLHYVSIEASPVTAEGLLHSVTAYPDLMPLAQALAAQWSGLLPGVHRLVFEEGHVLLTLHVRDVRDVLRKEPFTVDSVFLGAAAVGPAHAQGSGPALQARHGHRRPLACGRSAQGPGPVRLFSSAGRG